MNRKTVIGAVLILLLITVAGGLWVMQGQFGDEAADVREPTPGTGETEGSARAPISSGSDGIPLIVETPEGEAGSSGGIAALPRAGDELPAGGSGVPPPSFDVVRVEPSGDAVMAGRAPPGSRVTITDNNEPIAEVDTNVRGEWTFVSKTPLAPGDHEISLTARTADGSVVESEEVVVISVPEPQITGTGEPPATPVTVLIPKSGKGATAVLQAPRGDGIAADDLVLEALDYDVDGRLIISGRVTAGATVIVYLDNAVLGQTVADEDGRWQVTSERPLGPGLHELRVDQVDEDGKVVARVQTPFSQSQLLTALADDQFFVVQPGNSLWRIARRTYGNGFRYSLIFEANQDQIRNPDLIYPGQIFILPGNE